MRIFRCTVSIVLIAFGIVVQSNAQDANGTPISIADSSDQIVYTLEVFSIIDTKCMNCHNPQAKADKAKMALQWVQLQSMDALELVTVLDEIIEVLDNGEMPPARFLERFPEKALTEMEVKILRTWADAQTEALLNE